MTLNLRKKDNFKELVEDLKKNQKPQLKEKKKLVTTRKIDSDEEADKCLIQLESAHSDEDDDLLGTFVKPKKKSLKSVVGSGQLCYNDFTQQQVKTVLQIMNTDDLSSIEDISESHFVMATEEQKDTLDDFFIELSQDGEIDQRPKSIVKYSETKTLGTKRPHPLISKKQWRKRQLLD